MNDTDWILLYQEVTFKTFKESIYCRNSSSDR